MPLCAMADMTAVPVPVAFTLPPLVTVATFGLLETHLMILYRVFLGCNVAFSAYVLPALSEICAFLNVTADTARERTTSVQELLTPLWAVAVICTLPGL